MVFVLNSLWLKIASKAKQNKQTKKEKQQLVDRPFLEQGVVILFFTKIIYVLTESGIKFQTDTPILVKDFLILQFWRI